MSGYGGPDQSDEGDIWIVELEGGKEVWEVDAPVRLAHMQTQAYLMSHDKKYGRPISGQQEIAASRARTASSLWAAAEGVYFPQRKGLAP